MYANTTHPIAFPHYLLTVAISQALVTARALKIHEEF
jgi:hypothetical protein